MRKLLFILFLAMLPLQWTAAAVASLCLPDARPDMQVTASAQAHAHGWADRAGHAHGHRPASAVDQASHHHGVHDMGHDGKTRHADHGGCCHAAGSALPTRLIVGRLQPAPGDLVARTTVLTVSHSSDSPFRPPRPALA